MATKKTSPKSKTTKPKVTKSKTTKVASAKKRTVSPKPTQQVRYIGLKRDEESFMTFRVNRETFYWLVLGVVVIGFTTWIMHLQNEIQMIYDQIDANTMMEPEPIVKSTERE